MRALAIAVLALVLAPAAALGYDKQVTTEVYIPMDDGVRLAATIGFPSADGKAPAPGRFPVVLTMTPYSKDLNPPSASVTRQGYVHAVVDIRGAGASEGNLDQNYFSPREQRDGYFLVEWLAARPWSTGNVGMIGGSYLGITQYSTAIQQPPHLKAIVPSMALEDLYRDATYHGGILSQFFGAQYLAVQGGPGLVSGVQEPNNVGDAITAKLSQARSRPIAFDYVANTTDTSFYRDRSPGHRADRIRVPTLIYDGWFDGFLRGATEMYTKLARREGVETRLWIDPVPHKGPQGLPYNPYGYPAEKLDSFFKAAVAFLDHYLKGAPAPEASKVKLFIMGRDRYLESSTWPPEGVAYRRLYLRRGGFSSEPVGTASGGYATNPLDGLTNTFSRDGNMAASPFIQVDQSLEREGGIVWETPPLDRPLTLVGPLALDLFAKSTADDTDWIARVSDVAPDGSAVLLTLGYLRASHRALDESKTRPERPYHLHLDPTPIEPGATVPYEIEIWPTANEFKPGHRLRVQLTSNDTPNHAAGTVRLDVNDPSKLELHPNPPALNTVLYGGANGSSIVVPELGDAPAGLGGVDAYRTPFADRPALAPPSSPGSPPCPFGARERVTRRGIGRARVGRGRAALVAALGQPAHGSSTALRYCVARGGAVYVALSRGTAMLVVSTSRGHGARGIHRGSSARTLRRAFPDARRAGSCCLVGRRTGILFGARRAGKVRFVGTARRSVLRSPSALRRYVRRAGL